MDSKIAYVVELEGCDDSTYFKASLTEKERDFVIKLALSQIKWVNRQQYQ